MAHRARGRPATRLEPSRRAPAAATGQAWRATSTTLSDEAPAHLAPVTATACGHGTPGPSIGPPVPIAPVSVRAWHTTSTSPSPSRAHLSAAHWPAHSPSSRTVLCTRTRDSTRHSDHHARPWPGRDGTGDARSGAAAEKRAGRGGGEEYLGLVLIARATRRVRIARRGGRITIGRRATGPDSGHLDGNGDKSGFACLVCGLTARGALPPVFFIRNRKGHMFASPDVDT